MPAKSVSVLLILQSLFVDSLETSLQAAGPLAPGPTLNLNAISFGADPTGRNDSSQALHAAILAAAAASSGPPGAGGIPVGLDLAGGVYFLSHPLIFKDSSVSNIQIYGGTLIANATSFSSSPYNGTAFLLDFTYSAGLVLRDLTLDASHAGGCIRVDTVLASTLTRLTLLHYSTYGLLGDAQSGSGHELLVSDVVIAEYDWGEPGYDDTDKQSGTGIAMLSYAAPDYNGFYDSNFYSIIIRCTRLGVANRAGANLYSGLHVYSTCNKAKGTGNISIGFLSDAGQTRLADAYLDDSPLVVTYPAELTVHGSLVYGHSSVIFAPQSPRVDWASGWVLEGSLWSDTAYASPGIYYSTANGSLAAGSWHALSVKGNKFDDATLARTTLATAAVALNATYMPTTGGLQGEVVMTATALVDFSKELLFLDGQAEPPYAWQDKLGQKVLEGLLRPKAWGTTGAVQARGIGEWQPSVRGRGARPSELKRMEPRQSPGSAAPSLAGGIASVTGSVVTTTALCSQGVQGEYTTAAWAVEQAVGSNGAPLPGILRAHVRLSMVCSGGTGGQGFPAWAGTLTLQADQSPM